MTRSEGSQSSISRIVILVLLALAPFNVLEEGRLRTDADEECRRKGLNALLES
jgi:hypothetical protein